MEMEQEEKREHMYLVGSIVSLIFRRKKTKL